MNPSHDLPVAAHPAVFPPAVGTEVRRVIVDELDIGNEAGPRIGAFDQIVAEQGVFRKAALQHLAQRIHFIDTFAGKDAFAEKILIHVRDGVRVDIESGLSRV